MVASRIGSRTGKLQDGLLQILHLDGISTDYEQALHDVIKRSEMEYEKYENRGSNCYVRLRRYVAAHDFFGS